MPYLDDNEQFFDYRTSTVNGNEIFDTNKTGMSYYDNFINDPSYMEKSKNLKAQIVNMTPKEYFEGCAKIFNSTVDKQISQTRADRQTIEHLMTVLKVYKKRFPITFLNYAQQSQEGRHRMLAAAQYCGWEVKHPVMIITWADQARHEKDAELERVAEVSKKVKYAVNDALRYTFTDIDEFENELQSQLNKHFNSDFDEPDVEFNFKHGNDESVVTCNGGSYEFRSDAIRIEQSDDYDFDHIDLDIDDIDDIDTWLQNYLK